jgi:hypothetical protein
MAGSVSIVAVVVHPFGTHSKGDIISNPTELAAIKQSGQAQFVVFTQLPTPAASAGSVEETR